MLDFIVLWCLFSCYNVSSDVQMEEKVKEVVEIKQRSLAEENQKTMEVLKERYHFLRQRGQFITFILTIRPVNG